MARPAMMVPSMTACGSCRKIRWSLQVPGSLSSPLTRTYLGLEDCLGTKDHLSPAGKPAPPRPRRLEAFISVMIHSGPWARHFLAASYPPSSMYLSILAAPWPKRFDTILTSSGWETSLGIFSFSLFLVLDLGPVLIQDSWNVVGGQFIVEGIVDLDGGRPAADADTFHFFEREDAVWCDALVADAEFILEAFEKFIAAAQHATDIGADLHIEFARGLEAQHGVVGGDVAHFKRRDGEALGDLVDHGVGEVPDLILGVEEHGDQGGTLDRIFVHKRVKAGGETGRKDGHRVRICFLGVHCINSRAQASAAISISSSLSPEWSRPACVNSSDPARPSSRSQFILEPLRWRSSQALAWRTVIRSSPNSTVAW